jgi:hypothetical protein
MEEANTLASYNMATMKAEKLYSLGSNREPLLKGKAQYG